MGYACLDPGPQTLNPMLLPCVPLRPPRQTNPQTNKQTKQTCNSECAPFDLTVVDGRRWSSGAQSCGGATGDLRFACSTSQRTSRSSWSRGTRGRIEGLEVGMIWFQSVDGVSSFQLIPGTVTTVFRFFHVNKPHFYRYLNHIVTGTGTGTSRFFNYRYTCTGTEHCRPTPFDVTIGGLWQSGSCLGPISVETVIPMTRRGGRAKAQGWVRGTESILVRGSSAPRKVILARRPCAPCTCPHCTETRHRPYLDCSSRPKFPLNLQKRLCTGTGTVDVHRPGPLC